MSADGLPPEHRLLRDTVRAFAVEEIAPVAAELDRTSAFPTEIVRKLIQAKLADLATEIVATRLLTHHAARLKDAGEAYALAAAQAKLKAGRLAVRAAEEAVQIHGGYGVIEEFPVCRFYRDAKVLTIGEGTDEIQQLVIARALGA